jgi:hypothetical protein
MTSLRDDATMVHEVYPICSDDRGEAMRNDDARTSHHEVVECLLYQSLGLRIKCARRLIEDEYLWVREDSACYGDALFFSS